MKKGLPFALSMIIAFAGITGAMEIERVTCRNGSYGDSDGDREVTANDAQYVLNAYTNYLVSNEMSFSRQQFKACDIDSDRDITAADAQYILLYYTENSVTGNPTTWKTLLRR